MLKLLEGLEGRGHHVYTDNYYTSPTLCKDLRRLGFGACGTVRVNRCGMPEEMKAGLKKGETISKQVDSSMMALKWMDKGGGIDKGNQLETYYGFSHHTLKWWRWFFFHLIEMAIVNAYILYLMTPCSDK